MNLYQVPFTGEIYLENTLECIISHIGIEITIID